MQKRTLYLLTLLEFIWFGVLWRSAGFGLSNVDEAFYLTASHLVFEGQVLYRDFAFTQGPVLPFVYGAVLALLGTNLAMGRFVSVALAALALALVLNLAHRLAGRRAALLAFVLLLATPGVVYYLALVKTYSLVAALMLWALAGALHNRSSRSASWPLVTTLVAGLAVLTRLSFLPVLGLLSWFWVGRGHGRASGVGLLVLGVVTLVLAASSNGNLLFDVLEFHLSRMREGATSGSAAALALSVATEFAPALILALLLPALWWGVPEFQSRFLGWWRIETDAKLLFLLIAAALVIVHFIQPAEFWEYQIPGYLLIVVLLAAMSATVIDVRAQPARTLLLAICIVTSSVGVWSFMASTLWPTSTLLNVSKVSELLAQRGRAGNTLLGRFNHLALASGLQVYPGNEMGMFSIADGSSPMETAKRHFLSKEAVTEALASCSATFVATDPVALFELSIPSLMLTSEAIRNQWGDLLEEKYRVIYSDQDMTIFERIVDKCGSTPSIGEGDRYGH